MKKCPFCKSDIEDNARFCLYCMKPLNEKEKISPIGKKRTLWPVFVVGVVLLALLVVVLLLQQQTPANTGGKGRLSGTTLSTNAPSGSHPQDTHSPTDTTGETNPAENSPIETTAPPPPESTTPVPPMEPTPEPTKETTPPPSETIPDSTEPESSETEVIYTYRDARAGDDFYALYENPGTDIVITGVSKPAPDGVYDIPGYIDGKRVIAITESAFISSNAKIVYVPATMKTIWNYVFAGCPLTDIYLRGNSIYIQGFALPSGVTIHCSATCHDRNLRYYKNSAVNYDATWNEWNG